MTGTIRRTCTQLARRPLFLALSAFGLILVAIGIIYAVRYFPARAKLDAAIAEARAKGEPVWFSDLDPGEDRNPSADAELLLALAMEIVLWEDGDPLADKLHGLKHSVGAKGLGELTQAEYDRLAEFAAANDRVLKEMAEVAKRGDCWFKYDYSTLDCHSIILGHLDALSNTRPAAATHVLATSGSKEDDAFVTAMDRYFNLAEFLQNEPFQVSCAVRLSWLDLGMTLVEQRLNRSTLDAETARTLAERFTQLEQSVRVAPTVLEHGTCILTSMANLDDPDNRMVVAAAISGASSWTTSSGNSYWFEEVLDATPEERQVARWNSPWNRPQLLVQQAFALDLRRRECDVIDVPGPVATKKLQSLEAEPSTRQVEMPLLYYLLPGLSSIREHAMSVGQRLVNAKLLLELAAKNSDEGHTAHDLKALVDTAIELAPAGYFSGDPLQYEIEGSTMSVFDVNPANGERVGEFLLRLFGSDELDVETTQVKQTSADKVGAP